MDWRDKDGTTGWIGEEDRRTGWIGEEDGRTGWIGKRRIGEQVGLERGG